ncbi:MAG: DUF7305 domain-containing protein [Planctomycetota bacterium]|jgi:hypothetical protein
MKTYNRIMRSGERGSALLLVLVMLVICLFVGTALLSLGLHGRTFTIRAAQEIAAQRAADAGLTKAMFQMDRLLQAGLLDDAVSNSGEYGTLLEPISPGGDGTYDSPKSADLTGSGSHVKLPYALDESLPNCDATYSYKVAVKYHGGATEFIITSVGKSGETIKTVRAIIGLQGLFDDALLVRNRLSLMPNTLVKGYNSADPLDKDIDLAIGTTSVRADSIPLGPGTVIDGDVFVGVGGDPEVVIGAGGTVTGEKYALLAEPDLPVITAPLLPNMGTGLDAKGTIVKVGPARSGQYQSITLAQAGGNPGLLVISGGDVVLHVTGDIVLGRSCEVVIAPDSSLTLYVDGNIDASNATGLNNQSGNVTDFQLIATGDGQQIFSLKAKSRVFGTIYAPNAIIDLYPTAEISGAIVGHDVTMKSGCTFYYDEALKNPGLDDVGVRLLVKRWYE